MLLSHAPAVGLQGSCGAHALAAVPSGSCFTGRNGAGAFTARRGSTPNRDIWADAFGASGRVNQRGLVNLVCGSVYGAGTYPSNIVLQNKIRRALASSSR